MINRVEYLALKARINEEMDNLKRLEISLTKLKLYPKISADSISGLPLDDEISCRIIGSYLHDYYCVLEKMFIHVAKSFGENLPSGRQWHKDLLEDMSLNITGVRTAFINKKTLLKVDELRGFRHVFRNAYGFSIDPAREQSLLDNLAAISAAIKKDIKSFFEQMDELIL